MRDNRNRSRSDWRLILQGLEVTDLTQKEYAKKVGCHPSAFGWWRKRFRQIEAEGGASSTLGTTRPAFVELRAVETTGPASAAAVRIEGASGAVATFATLPPVEYLAFLLREGS